MALLARRQQLKSSDGCTATVSNWRTDGTLIGVYGWYCNSVLSTPSGTSAEVDGDTAALRGSFGASTTKFTFTTPLNATQIASLSVGMALDTNDNPICSGSLSSWDATGGTWVQASAGFGTQLTGALCAPGQASSPTLIIGDIGKIFPDTLAQILYPYSRASAYAHEIDCNNNQEPYFGNGAASNNFALEMGNTWCLDIVNLGNYENEYALTIRGAPSNDTEGFYAGFNFEAGIRTCVICIHPSLGQGDDVGLDIHPLSAGNFVNHIAKDRTPDGDVYFDAPEGTGQILLGNEANGDTLTSSPGFKFFSSGLAATNTADYDSSIAATGGNGTPGSGAVVTTGSASSTGVNTAKSTTATQAGGACSFAMGTAGISICWGSGVPAISAPQGSLYMRTDGASSSTRMYVNTNGSTTWVAVTTAS